MPHQESKDRLATKHHFGTGMLSVLVCYLVQIVWGSVGQAQEPVTTAELAKRRDKITSLSDADRAELQRKFQDFEKLPEIERERLRKMHREIETNSGLKQTLELYCEWLKDLDVAQREQLRMADTPEKKKLAVERIRREQQQRQKEERQPGPIGRESEFRRGLPPLLSSEELKTLMTVLESSLVKANTINPGQLEQLNKLHGTVRYKRVLQFLAESRHSKDGPKWDDSHLPEDFKRAMLDAVKKLPQKNGFDRMGIPLAFVWLRASLLEEAQREFAGSEGDELRACLFKSLSPQKQTEFLQMTPESHPFALKRMYTEELFRACAGAFDLPRQPGDALGPKGDGLGVRGGKEGTFGFRAEGGPLTDRSKQPFQQRPRSPREGEERPKD